MYRREHHTRMQITTHMHERDMYDVDNHAHTCVVMETRDKTACMTSDDDLCIKCSICWHRRHVVMQPLNS